eukprot:scaffold100889_cov31-Tisochrysis_lutea.AAC.2
MQVTVRCVPLFAAHQHALHFFVHCDITVQCASLCTVLSFALHHCKYRCLLLVGTWGGNMGHPNARCNSTVVTD